MLLLHSSGVAAEAGDSHGPSTFAKYAKSLEQRDCVQHDASVPVHCFFPGSHVRYVGSLKLDMIAESSPKHCSTAWRSTKEINNAGVFDLTRRRPANCTAILYLALLERWSIVKLKRSGVLKGICVFFLTLLMR